MLTLLTLTISPGGVNDKDFLKCSCKHRYFCSFLTRAVEMLYDQDYINLFAHFITETKTFTVTSGFHTCANRAALALLARLFSSSFLTSLVSLLYCFSSFLYSSWLVFHAYSMPRHVLSSTVVRARATAWTHLFE